MSFGINLADLIGDNPELGALFNRWGSGNGPQFKLKRGQRMYNYVGEHGKTMYCYTPHRAEDGYFYTFEYVEYWRDPRMKTKKGQEEIRKARTPYAKSKAVHMTKARTRKLAYKRACDRYNAAIARSRKEVIA
jgi:hypothetical protein